MFVMEIYLLYIADEVKCGEHSHVTITIVNIDDYDHK